MFSFTLTFHQIHWTGVSYFKWTQLMWPKQLQVKQLNWLRKRKKVTILVNALALCLNAVHYWCRMYNHSKLPFVKKKSIESSFVVITVIQSRPKWSGLIIFLLLLQKCPLWPTAKMNILICLCSLISNSVCGHVKQFNKYSYSHSLHGFWWFKSVAKVREMENNV